MKELSIEEKAKRYDEAIERVNSKWHYKNQPCVVNIAEIFPELKESEDERIITSLINCLKWLEEEARWDNVGGCSFKDVLAWLEKQGSEQHSQCKSELENVIKCLINGMRFYYEDNEEATWGTDKWSMPVKHIIEVLEKQGEQKHQYKSRPRYVGEEELLGTNKQGKCPFLKQELIDMGFAFTQDGDLAYPIHKIENKEFAAWSEEDEKQAKQIERIVSNDGCTKKLQKQIADWFKSLKDRVQPKQEWSEEDRKIIIELIGIFESAIDGGHVTFPYRLIKDYIRVLKSCLPQTTWKPSEEQMKFLFKYAEQNNYDGRILGTLYNDLKKLREEDV